MNGNINRNSLDQQTTGIRSVNHNRYYQDRGIKRYKSRNSQMNDNVDFRISRNNSLKNNYRSYDEKSLVDVDMMKVNHDRADRKSESFSHKCFNGDKMSKNNAYIVDRKQLLNSAINEYPKTVTDETNKIPHPKNAAYDPIEKCKVRENKFVREKVNTIKEINSCNRDKIAVKLKLNFLQESQLTVDKSNEEACSDHSKDASVAASNSSHESHRSSNNGFLNPAASEFTPSNTNTDNSSFKTIQEYTDAIETRMKSLSVSLESGTNNTIYSPPIPDNVYGYINHLHHQQQQPPPPLAIFTDQSYPVNNKPGIIDQSAVPGVVYHSQPTRQHLSRLNYQPPPQQQPPAIMATPHFQVALYGHPNPQLIRYNIAQNGATGNYIVCNPIMFNHLYSGSSSQHQHPLQHNIAHPPPHPSHFNGATYPHSSYYTDSINSALSHIR